MQLVVLGKISVATAGTPVPITAAMIAAAGGALPPNGGVAKIEMGSVSGATGVAYVKGANGLVIAPMLPPANGYTQRWRVSAPRGGNTINPLFFAVDADNSGDGVYVNIWID